MRRRDIQQMDGASVPLSLALYNETNGGWVGDQREQFWARDDVPTQLRGEGPARPDPRVLLTDDKAVLTEYARAKAEWERQVEKLNRDRINWLRRAAKERT